MGDLSSTEVIGGVSIEITAPITNAVASFSKITVIAKETKAVVTPTLDTAAITAQVSVAAKNIQSQFAAAVKSGMTAGGDWGAGMSNWSAREKKGQVQVAQTEASALMAQQRGYVDQWKRIEAAKTMATIEEATKRTDIEAKEAKRAEREITTGASGRTGAGSSGGGRAAWMNPFSNRGLARMLGSAGLVYGTSIALEFASGLAEAAQASTRSGEHLRDWQTPGLSFNVASSEFLQSKASQKASSTAQLGVLESAEGIFLIGSLVKLADAATGAGHALRDEQKIIEEDVASYTKARENNAQFGGRIAGLIGDKAGAGQRTAELNVLVAQQDFSKTPNDETLHQLINAHLEQQAGGVMSRFGNTTALSAIARSTQASQYGEFASAQERTGDILGAVRTRHFAERAVATAAFDEKLEGMRTARGISDTALGMLSPESMRLTGRIRMTEKEKKASLDALGSKHHQEEERAEIEHGARITAIRSSIEADQMRTDKKEFQASLMDLDRENKDKLANIKDAEEKRVQIATDRSHRLELISRHDEEMQIKASLAASHVGSAMMRVGRNFFGAEVNDFDAETKAMLKSAQLEDRPGIAATRLAAQMQMGAARGFELSQDRAMLTARAEAATVRQGMNAPGEVLNEQSQLIMERARMKNELAATDPALREQTKATMIAELKAQQVSLTMPMHASYGTNLRPGLDAIGNLPRTGGENIVPMEIAKSIKELSDFKGGGDATDFLKTIAQAVVTLAQIAGNASGLGPVIGQ